MPAPLGILVNAFDAERFLGAALESLLAQSFDRFELLVVDDASTDRTPEILAGVSDPRLRRVRNERNLGIPATLNRGLAELATPLVARLDADDLAFPGRLERQVAFLDAHPDVALVASDALYVDAEGRAFAECRGPTEPDEIRERLPHGCCIVHSSVVYRAEAVASVGGYRTELPLASDYDLWIRLSERHRLASIGEPLVGYRVHRDQLSTRRLRLQRRLADRARLDARARRGLDGPPPGRGWGERLRGADDTLGGDLLYWSDLYERMGRPDRAFRIALRGLAASPLSAELWRRARRTLAARREAGSPAA